MDLKVLTGKTILIISPQQWSAMKVSKHHFAIELRKHSNEVFFLNPNSERVNRGSCRISFTTEEGIKVLDYRPLFPMRYKFRFNNLFNFFIRREVRNIIKTMGKIPDIVWDFEPNRQFYDLDLFGSKIKIYHPVDITQNINGNSKNADVVFSVSDLILALFKNNSVPKYFINHGLSSVFASRAIKPKSDYVLSNSINAGYIGNLRMPYINHKSFKKIISENQGITFHIWGPYNDLNMHGEFAKEVINDFVNFLKESNNVTLYGMCHTEEILKDIERMDLFFWCFDNERDPNKGANSHKILEYLSTGRVVVSSMISTYALLEDKDLIIMPEEWESFEECFSRTIQNLKYYNNSILQGKRIAISLENSYNQHLSTIDKILLKMNLS